MREIFIPNRRNYNGRRYGFVRFKRVNDTHSLAKQLDRIVMGGLKLQVNIPKYGREKTRSGDPENQPRVHVAKKQSIVDRAPQQSHTKPVSYAAALKWNIRPQGRRLISPNHNQGQESSKSSVVLDVSPEDYEWGKDAWVGRLKNMVMFNRVEEELLWETGMDISPKYIGDDLVLLLGLTNAGAEQLINGENQ